MLRFRNSHHYSAERAAKKKVSMRTFTLCKTWKKNEPKVFYSFSTAKTIANLMHSLIFWIEGHRPQLYFNICKLSAGITCWLYPFLHFLRTGSGLLVFLLLPMAVTPCLSLWPRPFKGSTANLQIGDCLRFTVKPHACSCLSTCDATDSQTSVQSILSMYLQICACRCSHLDLQRHHRQYCDIHLFPQDNPQLR